MKKIIKILVISYLAIIIVIALLKPIFDLQSIGEYYGVMTGTIIVILFVWIIIYNCYIKYKKKIKSQQYTTKFEEFYNILCKQDFEALEIIRKQIKIYDTITSCLIIANALLFIIAMIPVNFIISRLIIILVICLALFVMCIYFKYKQNKLKKHYKLQYKQEIMRYVISAFNSNLEYSPNDTFGVKAKEQYDMASFDNETLEAINSEDYIVGRMGNTYVEMCDIVTYHKGAITFGGVFAIICNKLNINSRIEILNTLNVLDDFEAEYQVDNNEFEKYFSIKAEDRILATRILTHDVTNVILNLYKEYGMRFDIVIKNSTTYIRFPAHHIFKIDLEKEILDKQQIYEPFVILQSINEIVSGIGNVINTLDM